MPEGRRKASAVPDLEDRGPEDHLTECLADEAAKFIAEHANSAKNGQPFFLNLWHYAVHTPIQAERDKVAKYKKLIESQDAQQRHRHAAYAGLVEHLDDSVGRVLQAIQENGLEENTIVVFFSDNGGEIRNGLTSNYPLRDGKVTQYQGGVRVPMFVRWPGVTRSGAVCNQPVIGHDLYPTILKMTGTEGDPQQNAAVDGLDLTPLMHDPAATLSPRALHWLRYPAVFHYKNQRHQRALGPVGSMVQGDWKLLEFFKTPQGAEASFELYNLREDPSETNNLAAAMPEKVQKLHQAMVAWRQSVDAPSYESAYQEYAKIE